MPSATDILMNDARCIESCIPGTDMKLAVLISLFAQAAGVTTDTKTLMDGAKCIQQCIPGADMKLAVLISLLSQLSSIGGGGQQQIFSGTGIPAAGNAVPDPGSPAASVAIWIQTDSIPPNQITDVWVNGAWQ